MKRSLDEVDKDSDDHMNQRLRLAPVPHFECDTLVLDVFQIIGAYADLISHCLLRHTCHSLYKNLERRLHPPLSLTSDAFLHSLAEAHFSILNEARWRIYSLAKADLARFLYFFGWAKGKHATMHAFFPFFSALDIFVQGHFFAGCVRRYGFNREMWTKTSVYWDLHECAKRYGDLHDLIEHQDSDDYRPLVQFISTTLKAIIEGHCSSQPIGEEIELFLQQIGVLEYVHISNCMSLPSVGPYFSICVQLLNRVLLEYGPLGKEIVSTLRQSPWQATVLDYYLDDVVAQEYLNECSENE